MFPPIAVSLSPECSSGWRSSSRSRVAPQDADQGISQKIFYFHVLVVRGLRMPASGWGAWKALRRWKGD